jgi:hypothetical protein
VSLSSIPLRASEVFIIAFLMRALCEYTNVLGMFTPYVFMLSYILLFLGIAKNTHSWEMLVIGTGFFLNFLIIAINRGSMPVSSDVIGPKGYERLLQAEQGKLFLTHSSLSPGTPLWFLGDVIRIPFPVITYVVSVGDVLISVGMFLFIFRHMKDNNSKDQ